MSTTASPTPSTSFVVSLIDRYWEIWGEVLGLIGSWANMLFDVLVWVVRSLIQRRARFGAQALAVQIVRVGTRSIGIVLLVSGCIGIILALQTAPSLKEFGQVDKVANLVGVAVFRELGPLIAAIVLTGFAGASIAAELGTMKVGEEIEALEAMALNPIRFLVMPRVIATAGSLIVLSVFADICSVVFGGVVGVFVLDIPYEVYKFNTLSQLRPVDFNTGLIKAAVFGILLGLIACTNGLKVTGGAAGVGKATTNTVVQTTVAIVICDLMFSALFFSLGLN
ncbi:MAG: ABC transporter permease [Planctomycetota bacterium]|nr:ABC transporter permease [Planctomycetota bacterium]MDA1263205.1 ABC transporter permease [Planctomycetota bacterium]